MIVGRNDDDCELGVGEDRSAVVEQVIGSEFDTGADNPPEGPEVVVDGVGDQEGIIRLEGCGAVTSGLEGVVAELSEEGRGGGWRGWLGFPGFQG